MKKVLTLVIAICLSVVCVGCGASANAETPIPTAPIVAENDADRFIADEPPVSEDIPQNEFEMFASMDYIACSQQDLYELSDLVIIGRLEKEVDSYVTEGNFMIATQGVVSVIEAIKGESKSEINIAFYGGAVTISEYISRIPADKLLKMGFDAMSEEERNTQHIGMAETQYSVDASIGTEYLLFLSYDEHTDTYFVQADAYGMRLMQDGLAFNPEIEKFEEIAVR